MLTASSVAADNFSLPPGTTFHWQLQGEINTTVDARMYDLDLFETPASLVNQLHADGRYVVCYMSAGNAENYRPDYSSFPAEVKGRRNGWPGEKWLDIRSDVVRQIMEAWLEMCAEKGFDGVEPDNIDG